MREVDDEIREIKKEIIESRGLVIKTNNLANSLAADIKGIAKRQAGYERRFNWNSAAAYFLFATLTFVGLKLALDARIAEMEAEKDELTNEVVELRLHLSREMQEADEREQAEVKAAQFYELVQKKKRQEAVNRYEQLRQVKLSPAEAAFFRDAVAQFRLDLSVAAYQSGLDLMRTGRYAEAADKFQAAIHLRDGAAHIPAVKYQLARALRRLGRQSEARVFAAEVAKQNFDRDLHDDATWLISQCAEELGDLDQARDSVRTILRRWPRSSLAPDARRRLRDLNLKILRGRQASEG